MAGENRTSVNTMPDYSILIPGTPRSTPGRGYGSLAIHAFVRPLPGVSRQCALLLGLLFSLCFLADSGRVFAASEPNAWDTVIAEHPATPSHLIAVDKSRQQMALFERSSPLRLSRTFPCTTGQAVGDKMVQGDLKTPEGIYFVVQRITTGLDFVKYGNEAYILNYPNPIDRLRGKTGYGIWIHGRGEPLTPLQTEGCVSMNNGDLAALGKLLAPGAPVALTGTFSYLPTQGNPDSATVTILENRVLAWAKAWSDRSYSFFDFYDKNAYSVAQGENFSDFQAQKERLFKRLPWITTTVHDIRVLQGPGYWVTWFYQDYKAPNLTTRGIRRLYWGPDSRGEFKILGMEWHPGMEASTLLASADSVLPPLENGSPAPAWPPSEIGTVAWYTPRNAEPRVSPLPAPAAPAPEKAEPAPGGDTRDRAERSEPAMPALVAGAAPKPQSAPVQQQRPAATADYVEDPRLGTMARPSPRAAELASRMQAEQSRQAGSPLPLESRQVSQDTSPANTGAHPSLVLPPALPSQNLAPGSQNAPAIQTPVSAQASLPPAVEAPVPPKEQSGPAAAQSSPSPVSVAEAAPAAQTPVAAPDVPAYASAPAREREPSAASPGDSSVPSSGPEAFSKPSSEEATAAVTLAHANLDDPLSRTRSLSAVEVQVENWRQAWENGQLDAYVGFYAPKAKQGDRKSASAVRRHKEKLWAKAQPASVVLTDLRVEAKGKRVIATMKQEYADSKGNGDVGKKILTFELLNDAWLITQEDWEPLAR